MNFLCTCIVNYYEDLSKTFRSSHYMNWYIYIYVTAEVHEIVSSDKGFFLFYPSKFRLIFRNTSSLIKLSTDTNNFRWSFGPLRENGFPFCAKHVLQSEILYFMLFLKMVFLTRSYSSLCCKFNEI